MVVITGNLTFSAPAITNAKRLIFNWMPNTYEPQTVMGTTNPVGFRQAHKWIQGEIHVLSEATAAMASYLSTGSTNTTVTIVCTQTSTTGSAVTWTFARGLFLHGNVQINDGEDSIMVYPFVAASVGETVV